MRADLEDPAGERLATAFGANVVLYGEGDAGSLRSAATGDGSPTITVEMQWGPYRLVLEGDTICTMSDHFRTEEHVVTAPFTGLVVGSLENPVALPGHPRCHLLEIDAETRDEIEREIKTGEFDGYRALSRNFRHGD